MHTSNSVWSRTERPDSRFWMVFSWMSAASASSACVIFFSIIAVLMSRQRRRMLALVAHELLLPRT